MSLFPSTLPATQTNIGKGGEAKTQKRVEKHPEGQIKKKRQINLLRGWPSPLLLPTAALANAYQRVLVEAKGEISVQALGYGPDEGFGPLRNEVGRWLGAFYEAFLGEGERGSIEGKGSGRDGDVDEVGERIVVTGGASQNLGMLFGFPYFLFQMKRGELV